MNGLDVPKNWTTRRALSWAAVSLVGFALALWLRYGVIQPEEMGILCGQLDAPGWCTPRQWLILWQHYNGWGWVALASAAIGLFVTLPRLLLRIVLANALLFSALALLLYNATHGSLALVLTLLALLRRR
ncbi:MAG TPA: hypothetical protein VGQ35_08885 [Dongiaceae bacterium]|jgi:hypothetical protein|nr:hypothetical protein [Dongiaceae bacterium]